MKHEHGLPCGVRLTAGLGGAGGTAALDFAAETLAKPERRDTLSIGVVFTAGSVPELSPIQRRLCEPNWRCISSRRCARTEPKMKLTLQAAHGVALCCWRAARRRTGSHHKAHALAADRAKGGEANSGCASMRHRLSGAKLGDAR